MQCDAWVALNLRLQLPILLNLMLLLLAALAAVAGRRTSEEAAAGRAAFDRRFVRMLRRAVDLIDVHRSQVYCRRFDLARRAVSWRI